jgi:hypothetical protein
MKLESIASVRSGVALRTGLEHVDDGVLAFQAGDFDPRGQLMKVPETRISQSTISARHFVGPGDVLFRSRGAINTAWAMDQSLSEQAVAVMPLLIVRPDPSILEPLYLAWLLNQPHAAKHFAREGSGTSMRVVTIQVLNDLELRLPPIEAQRSIATLAGAFALEQSLSQKLADLRYQAHTLQLSTYAESISTRIRKPERFLN